MEEKINMKELKIQAGYLKTKIDLEQATIACNIEELRETCFKIYDNCDHFIVLSDDNYDSLEGRHNYSYGCVKCGLNTRVLGELGYDYDLPGNVMQKYFSSGRHLTCKYKSDLRIDVGRYSYYGGFKLAQKFYRDILYKYPNIDDDDLDKALKGKFYKVSREDIKNKGKSRKRCEQNENI